jgi:aspartate 1-decarboxylase
VNTGDIVIVIAYKDVQDADVAAHKPKLVYVDKQNKIVRTAHNIHAATSV